MLFPAALMLPGLAGVEVLSAPAAFSAPGDVSANFVRTTPTRVYDSRLTPAGALPLLPNESRTIRVAGIHDIPGAADAFALNVTAVDPNANGYLTAWPAGTARPPTSNINFHARRTIANMAMIAPGSGGEIALFNGSSGTVHVLVDVEGWFVGGFHPIAPERPFDGRYEGALRTGTPQSVVIAGRGAVPSNARAVALNITVTDATATTFLTVWPTGQPQPTASNLNVVPGQTVANMATIGVGDGSSVSIAIGGGQANVLVDTLGWYDAGFRPLPPSRIMDTRGGLCLARLGPGETRLVQVAGEGAVPANAHAVTLNVTAVHPTATTYLTVWPAGTPRPTASNLNAATGVVPNMVTVGLGDDGRVALYNDAGLTDVLIDVTGWYEGVQSVGTTGECATLEGPRATDHPTLEQAPPPDAALHGASAGQVNLNVANLQRRLLALGYWVNRNDGVYDHVTVQAVMAFQKYMGFPPTGNLTDEQAFAMTVQSYKPAARSRTGTLLEFDKARQILLFVQDGKVVYVVNGSSGNDIPYTEWDQVRGGNISGDAHTPVGRYKVSYGYAAGWEYGSLGALYRPRYFNGGIAVHGSNHIPDYPASHGCVRVSVTFMDEVWSANLMPLGSEVWVY